MVVHVLNLQVCKTKGTKWLFMYGFDLEITFEQIVFKLFITLEIDFLFFPFFFQRNLYPICLNSSNLQLCQYNCMAARL